MVNLTTKTVDHYTLTCKGRTRHYIKMYWLNQYFELKEPSIPQRLANIDLKLSTLKQLLPFMVQQ
jgi:hypothetical protein